jgi:hypothetical protein
MPKRFEIQFRQTAEDRYTGVLLIEGREMGVGCPKTLEEIAAFLMPQSSLLSPKPRLPELEKELA